MNENKQQIKGKKSIGSNHIRTHIFQYTDNIVEVAEFLMQFRVKTDKEENHGY